jgi:5-deoxy-glucuronate isomerase
MTSEHLVRAGSTAVGAYDVVVTPAVPGWTYCGLRILSLPPGGEDELLTGEEELLVLPLEGSVVVTVDGERIELDGRTNVYDAVTDFAYVPRDSRVLIRSGQGGRFALPSARASRRLTPAYGPASKVPIELRGAGSCSRQVNNLCTPESFEADRLIVVEVLTPGGNWSSYPPHKHDEERDGEVALEEIYYFEVAGAGGFGLQRAYSSGPDRVIDVCAEVRTGDVVCLPHGYHGPSVAAPGHDLYYLNVMAGPGSDRAWRACDDPAHAWVRTSWEQQDVDPRLPLAGVR